MFCPFYGQPCYIGFKHYYNSRCCSSHPWWDLEILFLKNACLSSDKSMTASVVGKGQGRFVRLNTLKKAALQHGCNQALQDTVCDKSDRLPEMGSVPSNISYLWAYAEQLMSRVGQIRLSTESIVNVAPTPSFNREGKTVHCISSHWGNSYNFITYIQNIYINSW